VSDLLILTQCSDVVRYQHFEGPCCLNLQFILPQRWKQQGPPKCWYPTITLHGVKTQTMT